MKRVGARTLGNVVQRAIDGRDHLFGADIAPLRHEHLRIDRAEIRWRTHDDLIGAERKDRRSALGDVGYNDDEPGAGCLGHPGQPYRDLAVSAWGAKEQVEFLAPISAVEKFGEEGDAVRVYQVDHDRQPAVMIVLIRTNQATPQVAAFVLGLEQGRIG